MSGAPLRVEMSMPSANAVLTANAVLGLNSSLSVTNAVPTSVTPSVAVMPLSFQPHTAPTAAQSVAAIAAGTPAANQNAASALVAAGVALSKIPAATTPSSEPSVLLNALISLFDGSRATEGNTLSAPSAADAGPITASNLPGRYLLKVLAENSQDFTVELTIKADGTSLTRMGFNGSFDPVMARTGRWTLENGLFIGRDDAPVAEQGTMTEIDLSAVTRASLARGVRVDMATTNSGTKVSYPFQMTEAAPSTLSPATPAAVSSDRIGPPLVTRTVSVPVGRGLLVTAELALPAHHWTSPVLEPHADAAVTASVQRFIADARNGLAPVRADREIVASISSIRLEYRHTVETVGGVDVYSVRIVSDGFGDADYNVEVSGGASTPVVTVRKTAGPDQVPAPSANSPAPAPRRAHVAVGLTLAGIGGAAAWYTSAWAAAVLGGFLAPWIAVPALALSIGWITLGTLAGFAAFSTETWKGFPTDLKNSALSAGGMTFRFWARFGLIFDSVLRGKMADMNAPTPANIFKYPLILGFLPIAGVFVFIGYIFTPIVFVLGAAYRLVGTPFLAAFRGAREVIVGFLPWMKQVLDFIGRFIMRIFPFVGGLIVGTLTTAFFGVAAGAVVLAGPIARDAFGTKYKPASLPGWVAYRLTQLAALAAIVVTGAIGAAVGLLSSPVHIVMGALDAAFDWSGVSDSGEAFFGRWMRTVENDGALDALVNRGFPPAEKNLTLAARMTRVLNATAISFVTAFFLPFVSIATIVRATIAAFKKVDVNNRASRSTDETGTEKTVAARPGFILPAVLAALGAAAAVWAYAAFGAALLSPAGLWALAAYAAVAALGAGLGLALSQPQAWSGWLSDAAAEGKLSAQQAMGGWLEAGTSILMALMGNAALDSIKSVLGFVFMAAFTVAGAIAAVVSGALGALQAAVATPVMAAWTGFMALITEFLPFLRRFFNWVVEVLKNILPFFFGFIFGTIGGLFRSGWYVSSNLFRPVGEIFDREDRRPNPSEAQIGAGMLMALTLVLPALAAFVGSFVVGAIVGIPVALTYGLALGVRWAGTGEKSEKYFKTWERRSLPNALRKARQVVEIKLGAEGAELPIWRLYVRSASFLLAAIPSTIALLVSGAMAYVRSLADAKLPESKPEAEQASSDETPSSTPAPKAEPTPVGKPPVWLAAALGMLGLVAGAYAAIAFVLPLFATTFWPGPLLLGYAAMFTAAPMLGLAAGLAVSQPVLWKRLIPSALENASGGFGRSLGYWTAAGKAVGLPKVYGFVGGVLGLIWGAAGALFGAVAAGAVAAYEGARQVVYEMLPFLRTAFETLMQILRRVVPFAFGLIAGLVAGAVGSAAFGALLLARPYFKHVVADDFKHAGALGFLGNVFLKGVALVLGVIFGLIGLVAGILAALPYALTASVAFAFRFADIDGPVRKFFDHWTYGALRAEMQRLNQLTDRFQFPEGEAAISDGWIRMANIVPATFAVAFVATIAGWVGYFRSLWVAYKSSTSGGPIPDPVVDKNDRRWDDTWDSSKRAASRFFAWGVAGAVIGLGVIMMTSWTPLGLAGWLLVGALAGVGVLGALTLGAIIAALALIFWIDGQLR